MNVIGLLVIRDEEPFLPFVSSSLEGIVDAIVAIDDGSVDGGPALLRSIGATVIPAPRGSTFGSRRAFALEEGRRSGGTHFVVVDADEAFTAGFSAGGRDVIGTLEPGEGLALPFRTLWKGSSRYRAGAEYDLPLGCVFCDDARASYRPAVIHEGRLPDGLRLRRLAPEAGEMVHFQFTAWRRAQVKQAWYRCRELLGGKRAVAVNARYLNTLDSRRVRTRALPATAIAHLPRPDVLEALPPSWHLGEVLEWFAHYGPGRFEALQIWHVPELEEAFVAVEGRPPRSGVVAARAARVVGDGFGSSRAAWRRAAGVLSRPRRP